jgi:hypothetical protein
MGNNTVFFKNESHQNILLVYYVSNADYNPVKSFFYFFMQHLVLEHNFPPIMYCVPNRHG